VEPRHEVEKVDDDRLFDRVKRGDRQAFSHLYALYQSSIFRYAAHMCGASAADDVVQDTFVAMLRQPARFDPARGSILSYLLGIARHHVAKRLAADGHESPLDVVDPLGNGGGLVETVAAGDTPLEVVSREELVVQLREAIKSLPPVFREAVVLCELQELDYATAASIMRCPIGTVRSRLHRAKALLTEKLAASQRAPLATTRPTR
jgi:RNA polymerase sigma-70 factor (ECF subfamily)